MQRLILCRRSGTKRRLTTLDGPTSEAARPVLIHARPHLHQASLHESVSRNRLHLADSKSRPVL